MPSPKRKRIPSFIKTGARVTFERPDSYDFDEGTFEAVVVSVHPDEDEPIALSYMEDDDLQAQWASIAHVKRAEGATDAGDDEHLRATREPRARDQWEHATLGTVTVARVEGGVVIAYTNHDHPLAPSNRTIVGCAAEARGLFDAFTDEMKRASRPGGELSGEFTGTVAPPPVSATDWICTFQPSFSKRVGACEVEVDDARRAIRFVRDYVLPHAVAVAARAVYSPVDDDCEKLVELLRKVGGKVTRTAVLDRHLGRGWGKTERGSKARIDIAAEQGALLGRVRVSGTGAKGSPVTFELAAA